MKDDQKKLKNPQYVWASRIAFWLCLFFAIPLFLIRTRHSEPTLGNALTFAFYSYCALANYVLGYRLEDPPPWSRWLVPEKWVSEWRQLTYSDPEEIRPNNSGLMRVIGAANLITIVLLAFLSGKL